MLFVAFKEIQNVLEKDEPKKGLDKKYFVLTNVERKTSLWHAFLGHFFSGILDAFEISKKLRFFNTQHGCFLVFTERNITFLSS